MNILIIGLRKKDIDRLKNKFKNFNLSFILSENITSKSFNKALYFDKSALFFIEPLKFYIHVLLNLTLIFHLLFHIFFHY